MGHDYTQVFLFAALALVLGMTMSNLRVASSVSTSERKVWLRQFFFRKELEQLAAILFDLVPPHYAMQLIKGYVCVCVCGRMRVCVYTYLRTASCS